MIKTKLENSLSKKNKLLRKININKHNEDTKQIEKHQQTMTSFDKLYRKYLQDNVNDKNE